MKPILSHRAPSPLQLKGHICETVSGGSQQFFLGSKNLSLTWLFISGQTILRILKKSGTRTQSIIVINVPARGAVARAPVD